MINDDVKALRREHKEDLAGYRKKKYRRFGRAMEIVLKLRSDDSSTKAFYKLANKKLPKSSAADLRKNLTACPCRKPNRADN